MPCTTCHGTGFVFYTEAPRTPGRHGFHMRGYCPDCGAGKTLRQRDLARDAERRAAEAVAREYADSHVSA